MLLSRILTLSAVLLAVLTGSAAAQDYSADPTYGTVTLNTGFTPDPRIVDVQSGGSVDASSLNNQQHVGNCTGMIANAPDVRLNYRAGDRYPLILSVGSSADTTLVVNGPGGEWYCNDDGPNGLNPSITFQHPASGQYDIWIGTYGDSGLRTAHLNISEVTSQ